MRYLDHRPHRTTNKSNCKNSCKTWKLQLISFEELEELFARSRFISNKNLKLSSPINVDSKLRSPRPKFKVKRKTLRNSFAEVQSLEQHWSTVRARSPVSDSTNHYLLVSIASYESCLSWKATDTHCHLWANSQNFNWSEVIFTDPRLFKIVQSLLRLVIRKEKIWSCVAAAWSGWILPYNDFKESSTLPWRFIRRTSRVHIRNPIRYHFHTVVILCSWAYFSIFHSRVVSHQLKACKDDTWSPVPFEALFLSLFVIILKFSDRKTLTPALQVSNTSLS